MAGTFGATSFEPPLLFGRAEFGEDERSAMICAQCVRTSDQMNVHVLVRGMLSELCDVRLRSTRHIGERFRYPLNRRTEFERLIVSQLGKRRGENPRPTY